MTITFVGHGYVGLVTAAVFADLGNKVWVIGHTPEKISALNKGILPIYEPGLEEMVKRNIAAGRIIFTLDYEEAINQSNVIFICVGTPPNKDGSADLSTVYSVSKQIGTYLKEYKVIVVKSTVPPGTNKKVHSFIAESAPKDTSFDTASCPEFLREGSAISDTLTPDRIVIGTQSDKARKILLELHQSIHGPIVETTIETAEMIKYVANSILSTKISFANAISFLCDKVGADVEQVMDAVGLDKRIGRSFLAAGVGYGGSCFPKDVKALVAFAKENGYDFQLLKAVDEVNKLAIRSVVAKIEKLSADDTPTKGKVAGILGLAFKPNTDDMREAPSIAIIKQLKEKGFTVRAYDPVAMENARKLLPDITYVKNAYEAADDADILVVVTEWNEFKQLDLAKIKKRMKSPVIVDGRNIYDPVKVKELGFTYAGIGRS